MLTNNNPRSNWALALEVTKAGIDLENGHSALAATRLQELQAQHVRAFGPKHSRTIDVVEELALADEALGEYDKCARAHRRVLAHREQELRPAHPSVAMSRHGLGRCLLGQGQPTEALQHLESARTIWQQASGESTPRLLTIDADLARAHVSVGEYRIADGILAEALERWHSTEASQARRADLLLAAAAVAMRDDPARARRLQRQATELTADPAHPRRKSSIWVWAERQLDTAPGD